MEKRKDFLKLFVGMFLSAVIGYFCSFALTPKYSSLGLLQTTTILLRLTDEGLIKIPFISPANIIALVNKKYKSTDFEKKHNYHVSAYLAKGSSELIELKSSAPTLELSKQAIENVVTDIKKSSLESQTVTLESLENQREGLEGEIDELQKESSPLAKSLIADRRRLLSRLEDPEELAKNPVKLIYFEPISASPVSPKRSIFAVFFAILFALIYTLFGDLIPKRKK